MDRAATTTRAMAPRDLSVDLMRALCLLAVVGIHTSMLGIAVAEDGGLRIEDPLTALPFFATGSWFGQVMPLFFLLGGFASWHAMRSAESRGEGFGRFLRIRILRLGQSAAVFYAVVAVVFTVLVLAGLPQSLVEAALAGAGLMLWFMAAFMICQGFVRLVARHGARGGFLGIAGIAVLALAVDAVRFWTTTGTGLFDGDLDQAGLLNLWTVWPLLQLIGVMLGAGCFYRVRWWGWVLTAAAGAGTTAALGTWTYYSKDMLTNLNPPTFPLVAIGVMQLGLFQLLRPLLRRAAATRPGQAVMVAVGPRGMNLYLWHLLVMIGANGLCLATGFLPEPGSGAWWLSRIPVYVLVVAATLVLVWKLAVLERGRLGGPVPAPLVWIGLFCLVVPNVAVTRVGMDLMWAWVGTVLLTAGVVLARPAWADRLRGRLRRG